MIIRVTAVLLLLFTGIATAQRQGEVPTDPRAREMERVSISSRGVMISYLQRQGATLVGFRYPNDEPNLQQPRGSVKVERKGGYIEIDVEKRFDLPGPASDLYLYLTTTDNGRRLYPKLDVLGLGPERFRGKFTYVFWVVTTNGIAENLGEVLFRDDLGIKSDARTIDVTTRQPIFAMMITAEPHPYVTHPSSAVVLVSYGQYGTFTGSKGTPIGDDLTYVPRPEVDVKYELPYPDNSNLIYRHRQTRQALAHARIALAMAEHALAAAREQKRIDPRTPETLLERARARSQFSVSDEIKAEAILEEARYYLGLAERDYALLVNQEKPPQGKEPLRPVVQQANNCSQLAQEAVIYSEIAANQIAIRQKNTLIALLVEEDLALKEEIRRLEAEGVRMRARISELEQRIEELERRVEALEREVARLKRDLEDCHQELARARALIARLDSEVKRICAELQRVIGNLGEIEQAGSSVVIRLKSDILFPEAVWLLAADRDLSKDVRPRLAQLALLLQILFRDSSFQFIGHTDTVDTDEYNQWLSEQRALEVMRFFYVARQQVMSVDDPLRQDYAQKIEIADRLLSSEFPEWKSKSRPGGLGDSKMAQLRERRRLLLEELSGLVLGMGEQQPRVAPEVSEEDRQRNRRVEIRIELPSESSFEYCNKKD